MGGWFTVRALEWEAWTEYEGVGLGWLVVLEDLDRVGRSADRALDWEPSSTYKSVDGIM